MTSDDFLPAATGVGTHLQAVASMLSARGHQVMVITTRRNGQPERESWKGVRILRLPTIKLFGFYQALPRRKTMELAFMEFQANLVHHHYLGLMLVQGLHAANKLHIPQLYTYHMTEDHLTQPWPMRPFRGLISRGIRYCCEHMDHIVSVSENLAQQLVKKRLGTPISYISNPVNFPATTAPPEPRSSRATFTVLFAGRLNPEKNIPLLLRAFALVLKKLPEAKLEIAGEGSQRVALERLVAALQIKTQVSFAGFLRAEDLALKYLACDVFVLPSWVETQGLVAMEAMHFSRPILVARSVVSAKELVEEGVNGFLVDPQSETDLAERLLQLAADPPLRARMGQAGRQRAECFRPDLVIGQLEHLYSQTIAEHR